MGSLFYEEQFLVLNYTYIKHKKWMWYYVRECSPARSRLTAMNILDIGLETDIYMHIVAPSSWVNIRHLAGAFLCKVCMVCSSPETA